jgi:GntR family transcriptional regulator/MocR family aminotransferase
LASSLMVDDQGGLVLPHELVEPIITRHRAADSATASIAQAAYAEFVSKGGLDRHLRRTRRIYRQRRDTLIAALARWFPEATPGGIAAGLTVLVTLPPDVSQTAIEARALAAGVRVYPVSRYRTKLGPGVFPGLVLGYGLLTPAKIEQGVRLLAEASADARR